MYAANSQGRGIGGLVGQLSENSAAPSFVIAASTLCSCITTARNLTMLLGVPCLAKNLAKSPHE